MGEVYKARHRRLDKLVAVKLLGVRMQDERLSMARFLREMKAAARWSMRISWKPSTPASRTAWCSW